MARRSTEQVSPNDRQSDIPSLQLEVLKNIQAELVGLRDEVEVGFTATRMQNDRRFLDHERRLRDLENR